MSAADIDGTRAGWSAATTAFRQAQREAQASKRTKEEALLDFACAGFIS